MKKFFIFSIAFLAMNVGKMNAQNVGDVFGDGTFVYKITSLSPNKVQIGTGRASKGLEFEQAYWGEITILETVTGGTGGLTYAVTAISDSAFFFCTGLIGSLTIPNSIVTIGNNAFRNCDGFTGSLSLPNSLTSIGNNAFRAATFTGNLTIPNSVTSLGNFAFGNCTGFTSLTISNAPSIGEYAFSQCTGLTSIKCQGNTPPQIRTNTFMTVSNIPVYVPCGMQATYQGTNWSYFTNIQESLVYELAIISGDTSMGTVQIIQQPTCQNNSEAIIEATPNNCFHFVTWGDNNYSPLCTLTVTQNLTLTAIFAPDTFEFYIAVSSNNQARGTAAVTQQPTCQNNGEAVIEATANSGFRFVKWEDENTDNPRTITVTQNTILAAIFEADGGVGISEITNEQLRIIIDNGQLTIVNYNGGNVQIFDLTGRVVGANLCVRPDAWADTQVSPYTINISALPSGIYFVKIGNKTGKFVKK